MIVVGVAFLLCALATSATSVEEVQYPTRVLTNILSRADPFQCTAPGIVCSDCFTQAVCTGSTGDPVFKQTCSDVNSRTPYCSNNVCSATASSTACEVVQPGSSFQCTSEGTFPHPTDCNKSYYCPAVNGVAQLMTCGNNMVFNSLDGTCRHRLLQICLKIDCSRKPNAIVTYRPNPAYYAFCSGNPTSSIIMFKCLDEQNEVFDTSINACRYNCRLLGNYADRTNCAGYVNCSWRFGWVATRQQCAPNHEFRAGKCIRSSTPCVSEINVKKGSGTSPVNGRI